MAEHAAIDDGRLNLYVILPGTVWQLLTCVMHLKFGLPKPDVLHRQSASHVSLRTSRPRLVNADGEIVTKTPAEFTLLPERLTVMVPQSLPANHRSLVGSRKAAIWRFMEEEAQGFNINSRSVASPAFLLETCLLFLHKQ